MKVIDRLACPPDYNCMKCNYDFYGYDICHQKHQQIYMETTRDNTGNFHSLWKNQKNKTFCRDYKPI